MTHDPFNNARALFKMFPDPEAQAKKVSQISTAVFSSNGEHRYCLVRAWDFTKPRVCYISLNPSVADAKVNDATVRKLIGFATRHGFGSFYLVNLFSVIMTESKQLPKEYDELVGDDLLDWITLACLSTHATCICWGNTADLECWRDDEVKCGEWNQAKYVLEHLAELGIKPMCLAMTKSGFPSHPSRLGYTDKMIPFEERR